MKKFEEIGKIIGSHPYPIKLARNVIYKYDENMHKKRL